MTSARTTDSPPRKWYTDPLTWFLVGSIAYGTLAIVLIGINIGRPFPGFLTYHNAGLQRVEIEWNMPAWWWLIGAEDDSTVHVDDQLLSVEGTSLTDLAAPVEVGMLYAKLARRGENSAEIRVFRDGEPQSLNQPILPFSWTHFLDLRLAPAIIGLCFGLLAIVLYRASGDDPRQRLVIFFLLVVGLTVAASHPTLYLFDRWYNTLMGFLNPLHAFASAMVGAASVHLALRFPTPIWPRASRWIIAAAYGLGVVLLGLFFTARLTIALTHTIPPWTSTFENLWNGGVALRLVVGYLALVARMTWEVFARPRPRSRRARPEARIVLVALLALIPVVLFASQTVVVSRTNLLRLLSFADARYLVLALPMAFAVLTLRYRTFSGADRWILAVLMLTLSGFLANLALGLLFWNQFANLRTFAIPPLVILFVMFMLIGIIWMWLSDWRGPVGRILHWERVNTVQLKQFGELMMVRSYADDAKLAQAVANGLCEALELEHAVVYLKREFALKLSAETGQRPSPCPATLPTTNYPPTRALRLDDPTNLWYALAPDTVVVLPLTVTGDLLGLVAMGPRWDSAVFDDRTLDILDLIREEITIFLQNTQQSARLRRVDQEILRVQEHTQTRLAQDVHDFILPALGRANHALESAQDALPDSPEQAQVALDTLLSELTEATDSIRRVQQNLATKPFHHGLRMYLEELAWRLNNETTLDVSAEIPADLDDRVRERELREGVYAIAQQALDNVVAHANATSVSLNVRYSISNQLVLEINDNGDGVSAERLHAANAEGRFGLRSMQLRAQALSGTFRFDSTPGHGSQVLAIIPYSSA